MPRRFIRWVEGTTDPEICWNKVTVFAGQLGDKTVQTIDSEDCTSDHYEPQQLKSIRTAAASLVGSILHRASGAVVRWHYDGEVKAAWWDEAFTVGGRYVEKRIHAETEELVTAGQALLLEIARMMSTKSEPVETLGGKDVRVDLRAK